MDRPLWFQQLRDALRARRVAPYYAERFMDELWYHYLEMKENDQMNGSLEDDKILLARLGKPEILAAQAELVQYSNWLGRHPWLAFFYGPTAIFLGLLIAMTLFSVGCIIPLTKGETIFSQPWSLFPYSFLGHLQLMSIAVMESIFLCYLLHKSNRGLAWWALSCGVISILCCMANLRYHVFAFEPFNVVLDVGFSIPWYWFSTAWFAQRLPRTLVPIGIFAIGVVLSRKPPRLQQLKRFSVSSLTRTRLSTAFPH
jgi:hypothetical protein